MNNQVAQSKSFSIDHILWLGWLIPVLGLIGLLFSISPTELTNDWLDRELGDVLTWWLIATTAGIGVYPLLFRVLHALPDRGYTVARPAGIMLTGFLYWFMTSLQLTRNEVGTIVLAWVMVVLFGVIAWLNWNDRPSWRDLKAWLIEHYALIIMAEVIFMLAFVAWAFVQAHNPEIASTEKPMEMTFINGIRNSEVFPPKDPWLSGYSISYYYFGYVIIAGLADLSNIATPIAFNLANALTFALTATGVLGLLYNLVRVRGTFNRWRAGSRTAAIGAGLLGIILLLVMGHLSTFFIEFPNRNYDTPIAELTTVDQSYFEYWDIHDRAGTSDRDNDGTPDWADDKQNFGEDGWSYWWWFAHSRVVQDRDFNGNLYGEPIVEFPQFSFVLSDNHPHVLALPYAILALSLIAGLVLRPQNLKAWEIALYAVFIGGMVFMNAWDAIYIVLAIGGEVLRRLIRNGDGQLSGFAEFFDVIAIVNLKRIILGLLVFLVLLLLIVIFPMSAFSEMPLTARTLFMAIFTPIVTILIAWGLGDHDWGGVMRFGASLGILSWIFYAPWYISFTSQANGIYPNIIHPTRYQQFFLQFGIFMFIIGAFLVLDFLRNMLRFNWVLFLGIGILGIFLSYGIALGSTYVLDSQCKLVAGQEGQIFQIESESQRSACEARQQLFGGLSKDGETLYQNVLGRRQSALPNQLFLLIVIGYVGARLFPLAPAKPKNDETPSYYHPGLSIALLILAAGAVIILVPDLFYVRDVFNRRMNTIFKMYYQGWLLFSVASAYGVYYLLSNAPQLSISRPQGLNTTLFVRQIGLGAMVLVLVGLGMLYPYHAIQSRYIHETGRRAVAAEDQTPLTLDGSSTISEREYTAITCLHELEPYGSDAIILETPFEGGYRVNYGRFSMMTGLPTLLGWRNHESQWRGDSFEDTKPGERFADAERIYTTENWLEAETLITKYGIDYIIVGDTERQEYSEPLQQRGLDKFAEILEPACTDDSGTIAVYAVSAE